MENQERKPTLLWAILSFILPVGVILYGTVAVGVRPPILPLLAAVALAGGMALRTGYKWNELQEGMLESLGRVQIAVSILILVGMIISSWLASGTIPAIIYWGLKLIAPEYFLVSSFILCAVASVATGTSFGTMGTLGVALLGVGGVLGFPPAITVGAIVSGAYFGDKMSPVSDSTNITASVCGTPLFSHIASMFWTTVPAAVFTIAAYFFLGAKYSVSGTGAMENLGTILTGLEANFSMSPMVLIPPVLMIILAYRRYPVLPVMALCIASAIAIAMIEGSSFTILAKQLTTGYKAHTGTPGLDKLLSRGGLLSIMPTVLLLLSGMAFGGILERSRVLEVLLDSMLKGSRSVLRLITATLASSYVILLGTGSQMLAAIVPGRAFQNAYDKLSIDRSVLSRTCEDAGTLGCPLIPWSVHAFYILGVLGVSAYEFAPYAILNWVVPVFSITLAATGIGIRKSNPAPETLKKR